MNVTQYKGSQAKGMLSTGRRPSDSIWADCPWSEIQSGHVGGATVWDDFTNGGLITSPTTEAALVGIPYSGFGSAGTTITHGDETGGAVVLTQATDNLAVYMKAKTHPFQISSHLKKLWFEGRVKVNAITNNQIGFLFGLFDNTAMTVIVPLSTANPPIFATTGNFVGFWGREQDAGRVMATYVADGVTSVTVESDVHQFVADTYVKLGMVFDPADGNKLSFFVNGMKTASQKVIPNNTGTDFPADVRLAPIVGERLGASASSLVTLDWWRCAQLI